MTISIYSGSVGSGKSYHSIETGLEMVQVKKKHVIANFPISAPKKRTKRGIAKWENILSRWHYEDEITVEYLMALSFENEWFGHESSCLVMIDEAGILFNSRDWQHERENRQKWIKFLSQSRKFGYDFIFICQMDRMIDKQIRGLVEYEVKHLKANNAKMLKFLSAFKVTMFLYVNKWYQTKMKGNVSISFYRSRIADRYDTMKIFNLDELIESMEKVYEGKVIPANIAVQISAWQTEIDKAIKEKEAKNA